MVGVQYFGVDSKRQMQEPDTPLTANNSNVTSMFQKSITALPAFFWNCLSKSAGEEALLSSGTLPGSSTDNKLHNREA